jgi:hypothetical protein
MLFQSLKIHKIHGKCTDDAQKMHRKYVFDKENALLCCSLLLKLLHNHNLSIVHADFRRLNRRVAQSTELSEHRAQNAPGF